jgi:MYXO-CTERM domain-containing protein
VIDGYKASPAPFSAGDDTRYVNILISDGQTSEGSRSVQAPLEAMASAGIDTYVIGFGTNADLDEAQLNQYAGWGQTGNAIIVDPGAAGGASALADAIEDVVLELGVDACCVLNECAVEDEPADPASVCGNGILEGEEVCDDGADNATYGHCGGRCDGLHLYCGDLRTDGPEECDDANTDESDRCTSACKLTSDDDDGGVDELTGGVGGTFAPPTGGTSGAGGFAGPGVRPARPDAGTTADAGTVTADDSGCSCSTPGPARNRPHALVLVLALVATRLRRRQRERSM